MQNQDLMNNIIPKNRSERVSSKLYLPNIYLSYNYIYLYRNHP